MTCCGVPPTDGSTTYRPGPIANRELLESSLKLDSGNLQTDFVVPSMHCIGCIRSLERAIGKLPFVERVRANLSLKKVSVVWRECDGGAIKIDEAITKAGFDHATFDIGNHQQDISAATGNKLLVALAVAGFAAVNIMLLSISIWSGADVETTRLFHLISGMIAVPAVFYSGRPFFESALSALKVRRLNMDVPISLAVLMALAMSVYESLSGGEAAYFDAAVTLLFFLLIGRYLDNLMREKARNSVVQLSRLLAKGAMLVEPDGKTSYVTMNEIKPGMILRVTAGERFGVDGEVVKGQGEIDRSLVTGESEPVFINPGTQIEAGTLNLNGVIEIRAVRDAGQSYLAEVTRMMEAAEKGRGRFVRIADRAAQIYAPAVHLLAALAFLGWMGATGGDWHASIYVAISVLIITCPCALGLAVPVVHVIAARRLFKEGILIRDGSAFERLEEVDHVIFDKTGTLSDGAVRVGSSRLGSHEEEALAKTLAQHSTHPFSQAVAVFVNQPVMTTVTNVNEIPGYGVEGVFNKKPVRLGRLEWVSEIASKNEIEPSDSTSGFGFAIAGKNVGSFQLVEVMRVGLGDAISDLKSMNLKLEIMSGDNEHPVDIISRKSGIDDYRYRQSPAEKIERICELQSQGHKVLMVGDGLNDTPALAAADVSMAPVEACDISRNVADFVFTRKSLSAVPFAVTIAKKTGRLVRQNFGLAILYNAIAIPFAVAGHVTPLIAAIAMSASSIVVVANSMRLNSGAAELRPTGKHHAGKNIGLSGRKQRA